MIDIMFCGNDKAYDGIIITLLSICRHTSEALNVYVITADLHELNDKYIPISDMQISKLDTIVKQKNPYSIVRLIDITDLFKEEMMNGANMTTSYTPYIFLRLFVDRIEQLPDKLLYLDNDIVCYKDISGLFSIDVSQYDFAAVKDYFGKWFIGTKYINSGVLLLNLSRLKNDDTLKKCRIMCQKKKMLLPDQTALNKYCKKLYLPSKYNEQKRMHDDTVLRHYSMTIKFFPWFHTVKIKPWELERIHEFYHDYDFDDVYFEYKQIIEE